MRRAVHNKKTRPASVNVLSFDVNASQKAIYRIQNQTDAERKQFIIKTFVEFFGDGMRANPTAFLGRFRKMAEKPFNFYRGSAVLYYQDLKIDNDRYIATKPSAGHIFIHVSSSVNRWHD
jgi:hypothetical protein